MGFVKSLRSDNTGIGFTLEYHMGIAENNRTSADFTYNGVPVELKAHRKGSSSRVTLFTKTPTWDPLSSWEIIEKYGYIDDYGRRALKVTLTADGYNSQGLKLDIRDYTVPIIDENGSQIAYFDSSDLNKSIRDKFGENMLYVEADSEQRYDGEYFHYNNATFYQSLELSNFWKMLQRGEIVFDFRMDIRERNGGSEDYFVRDRGPAFRIQYGDISALYENYSTIL